MLQHCSVLFPILKQELWEGGYFILQRSADPG